MGRWSGQNLRATQAAYTKFLNQRSIHLKYSVMMCKSDGEATVPFRPASITRRQASTVTWSPRPLAASSTFQAASSDLSGFGSSEAAPRPSHAMAPNGIAFIVIPPPSSFRSSLAKKLSPKKRGLALNVDIAVLARLIKFQNAPGRLNVEAAKLVFQVFQIERGDAVILCAEKKQCHGRIPRKVEGFGQNQQGFPVPVHKGSFDHIARQRA